MFYKRSHAGFTLVEMLVVIGIVALLAAILFPVFARAREKGRQTVCLSNLKQLGLGVAQYMSDYDGVTPLITEGGNGRGKTGGWIYFAGLGMAALGAPIDPARGNLYSYIKSTAVYLCPDDKLNRNVVNSGVTYSGDSYAINSCLTDHTGTTGYYNGRRESVFATPALLMLFGEEDLSSRTKPLTGSTDDGMLNFTAYNAAMLSNTISYRHSGGSNIAFLDGHSKWVADPNHAPSLALLEAGSAKATDCP